MTSSRLSPLVTAPWLRQRLLPLLSGSAQTSPILDRKLRLLDTSWLPEPEVDGYREFYQKGHIPSAVHFDLNKLSTKRPDSPIDCPIPDSNLFRDYVESLGISNDTEVIAYDSLNTRPSVRAWYLFKLFGHDRVSVLNGGMVTWQELGFPVTQQEPELGSLKTDAEFKVDFRSNMLLDYQNMLKIVESRSAQIVDSRPGVGGFFISDDDEKSGGHMPGAKSVPFGTIFNKDGTFKSPEDLTTLFAQAGVDPANPMVATCQRGMTACALVMAAQILAGGEKEVNVPMYNGSWFEWSAVAEPRNVVREKKGQT